MNASGGQLPKTFPFRRRSTPRQRGRIYDAAMIIHLAERGDRGIHDEVTAHSYDPNRHERAAECLDFQGVGVRPFNSKRSARVMDIRAHLLWPARVTRPRSR